MSEDFHPTRIQEPRASAPVLEVLTTADTKGRSRDFAEVSYGNVVFLWLARRALAVR